MQIVWIVIAVLALFALGNIAKALMRIADRYERLTDGKVDAIEKAETEAADRWADMHFGR